VEDEDKEIGIWDMTVWGAQVGGLIELQCYLLISCIEMLLG
jgi:hypothetical protein